MIKKVFMLLCIAMLYPYSSYSQVGNFDCLKDGPIFEVFGYGSCMEELEAQYVDLGINGVTYRVIGNKMEILLDKSKIDWNSWYLSEDAALDLIRYSILTQQVGLIKSGGLGITEVSFPFESECVSYPGCYIKLEQNAELICNEDPLFDYTKLITQSGSERYYRDVRKRVCGTKCCEVVYEVKYQNDNYEIVKKTIRDYPGSECQPTGLKDCKTGAEVKCESDCNLK